MTIPFKVRCVTLTSTGVSRDNGSSASGSSKTLKEKETKHCRIREKEISLSTKIPSKYSKHLPFVLTNKLAARRKINQQEGEGEIKHVLPFISSTRFPCHSFLFLSLNA